MVEVPKVLRRSEADEFLLRYVQLLEQRVQQLETRLLRLETAGGVAIDDDPPGDQTLTRAAQRPDHCEG